MARVTPDCASAKVRMISACAFAVEAAMPMPASVVILATLSPVSLSRLNDLSDGVRGGGWLAQRGFFFTLEKRRETWANFSMFCSSPVQNALNRASQCFRFKK